MTLLIRLGLNYKDTTDLYLYNGTGDVVGIVDDTLATVVEYTYSPWGEILSVDGGGANTIGTLNPFRYRGYYFEEETGLYYLNARYYDPEVGRFISADAFLDQGSLLGNNLFAYCFNNPINNFDPSGNSVIIATAAVAAMAQAALTAITVAIVAYVVTSYLVSPEGQATIRWALDAISNLGVSTRSFDSSDSKTKEKEKDITWPSYTYIYSYYHVTTPENALSIKATGAFDRK